MFLQSKSNKTFFYIGFSSYPHSHIVFKNQIYGFGLLKICLQFDGLAVKTQTLNLDFKEL